MQSYFETAERRIWAWQKRMRLRESGDCVHDAHEMRQHIMRIARVRFESETYELRTTARVHGARP